jgi:hypothetical protein
MRINLIRYFITSAGILLLVTAAAKLVSSLGSAEILESSDPIFGISFRHLFCVVATVELIVAAICFFDKRLSFRLGFVAWLATIFLGYRITLGLIGYHRPCMCLGNLTDALHISPQIANTVMEIILAYLLIGSYGALCLLRWPAIKSPISSSTGSPV